MKVIAEVHLETFSNFNRSDNPDLTIVIGGLIFHLRSLSEYEADLIANAIKKINEPIKTLGDFDSKIEADAKQQHASAVSFKNKLDRIKRDKK